MLSILPLAILFGVLLIIVLGAVIFLLLQQTKTNRQVLESAQSAARENLTFLSNLQSSQLLHLQKSAESTQERLSSQLSLGQTQLLQHLEVQTQEVMTTLATAVNQATGSISSTANKLSDLVASSQAMIAAKDTIAYQTLRGSTFPVPEPGGTEPYTSVEDLAQADADRQAGLRAAEQGLASIMKLAGVNSDEPYGVAGAGLRSATDPL